MELEFETAFSELNTEQRQAVTAIDGPVLVVAGPGTGKTQLLSTRVANILKKTDTRPTNILCLTYTNKAAIHMKERIIHLTGSDGTKLPVKTFHSFAGEVMNLYPDYFWNAARLSVAPESVQLEIIESIVAELPLQNPLALQFAGQYTLLSDIRRAISLAKDAGLTPAKLKAIIDYNLAYIDQIEPLLIEALEPRLSVKKLDTLKETILSLPIQPIDEFVYPLTALSTVLREGLEAAVDTDSTTGKATQTGQWKKRWLQIEAGNKGMFQERRRNTWWLALTDVYASYIEHMHTRGFYDYADMIVEVISKLEQHADMLADIQERFSYVLIDEFQDTTPAQLRLAHLVADHHASLGKPNLMVVGDDDQAIFKFSGAELNNMLGFKRRYPDAKVIVLTKNYRSSQQILDASMRIIEQAETRLVNHDPSLQKTLIAVKPPKEVGNIRAVSYASRELQFSAIAQQIKRQYDDHRTQAVLARGHDSLIKMAGLLQAYQVPIRYEQQSNILDQDIVQQIYLLTQLIEAIQTGNRTNADALIHQLIRHPMWRIAPDKLWQLAVTNYQKSDWLTALLHNDDPTLRDIGEWFTWLSSQASHQPLAITLEYLLGLRKTKSFTSPVRAYYTEVSGVQINQYFHNLSAIQLLRSLVHDFSKTSEPTLHELIRFIEINQQNGLIVPDESPFITGHHAVELMSVHKAKGLEFDDVYIIDVIEDNWQPRVGSRKPPANLPLQPAGDDIDDYIRLMYVATTRAKAGLCISGYYQDHAGKDVAISPIVQSAFQVEQITETNEVALTQVLEENLRWPDLSRGEEKAMLRAKLENYSLSVTHLINFLNLKNGGPAYFKERNLLRLPEAKSVHLAYGTAMHSALEFAQKQINTERFNFQDMIDSFTEAMIAEQLRSSEYTRFLDQGKQTLSRLFNEFHYELKPGSYAEQDIRDIRLNTARIRGKFDRVDFDNINLTITDYKTGKPLGSFTTKDKNIALKAHTHKLQLVFYAILATHYPSYSAYQTISGQMVYLEAEQVNQLQRLYTPSPEDIAHVSKLIQAVYARIVALDFPDISGYSPDIDGILAFENDLIQDINI